MTGWERASDTGHKAKFDDSVAFEQLATAELGEVNGVRVDTCIKFLRRRLRGVHSMGVTLGAGALPTNQLSKTNATCTNAVLTGYSYVGALVASYPAQA